MRAAPAGDHHRRSPFSHPISIQIEQSPGRGRKGIEILDEIPKRIDPYFCLSVPSRTDVPTADPVGLIAVSRFSVFNPFQKKREANLSFPQDNVINKRASQD